MAWWWKFHRWGLLYLRKPGKNTAGLTIRERSMNHQDHVNLLRGGIPSGQDAPANAVWADFGSGHGAFTLALAELLGPGGQIHSIDKDPWALNKQKEALQVRYPGVRVYYHEADFTCALDLPKLHGLVIANALHFIPGHNKENVVKLLKSYLNPGGRLILVEYNVDRGNAWVPYPLSFQTWEKLADLCGFTRTRLLARAPSSFLHEFYAGLSM
jgi:SAM-dependent methyltransferase